MATGDANDFAARLQAVAPARWFGAGATPVLTGILTGLGAGWAAIYNQITYTTLQTRIATATDSWLDGVATDFFGGMLYRLYNETDTAFRARIKLNLFAPKNTRAAVLAALYNLTGRTATIFEPQNTGDTGGYGGGEAIVWSGLAYNFAGGYGDLNIPYQFFVNAHRPLTLGIPTLGGYNGQASTPPYAPGGYYRAASGITVCGGGLSYINYAQSETNVTDAVIYATIAQTIPAATIAWTNISP